MLVRHSYKRSPPRQVLSETDIRGLTSQDSAGNAQSVDIQTLRGRCDAAYSSRNNLRAKSSLVASPPSCVDLLPSVPPLTVIIPRFTSYEPVIVFPSISMLILFVMSVKAITPSFAGYALVTL